MSGDQAGDRESSSSSFKSAGQYQVQISSSSECPSQRTVFVKCGGFECGQESFWADKQRQQQHEQLGGHRSSGGGNLDEVSKLALDDTQRLTGSAPVLNEFPWLVSVQFKV